MTYARIGSDLANVALLAASGAASGPGTGWLFGLGLLYLRSMSARLDELAKSAAYACSKADEICDHLSSTREPADRANGKASTKSNSSDTANIDNGDVLNIED